jgi:hypothetical protein
MHRIYSYYMLFRVAAAAAAAAESLKIHRFFFFLHENQSASKVKFIQSICVQFE